MATDTRAQRIDGSRSGQIGLKHEEASAARPGFVVVTVRATPAHRYVEATGYLNEVPVCTACGADNFNGTISTSNQSFTLPVRVGDSWRVSGNVAEATTLWFIPF